MNLRELLHEYVDGKKDAIETIRRLSGAFDTSFAVNFLSIICQITRIEQGDLDRETFKSVWGLK